MDQKHIFSGLECDHGDLKQDEVNDHEEVGTSVVVADNDVGYNGITNGSGLLSLPMHILELIGERCTDTEYIYFRATCKTCYLAAPHRKWRRQSIFRMQIYSSAPWLYVLDRIRGIITFQHPIMGNKYFKTKFPGWINRIWCSKFGWLLCSNNVDRLAFFNPFTIVNRELPLVLPSKLKTLCFSAAPTSRNCMVVGFTHNQLFFNSVAREQSWRVLSLDYGYSNIYPHCFPTFDGEDLHVLCNNGLNVFKDLGQDGYPRKQVVAKIPKICPRYLGQCFLMKCDQDLILVVTGKFVGIVVLKMNGSTKEWEKIDGIGNHMIYICDTTGFCIKAKSPEMENKIYFSRWSENGKIILYSLESCRYYTFNGKKMEECLMEWYTGVAHHYPHAWIEPSWH